MKVYKDHEHLSNFMNLSYQEKVCTALYNAIKFELPNIKNLKVEDNGFMHMDVTFDEGTYTKEEVQETIKKIRNYKP